MAFFLPVITIKLHKVSNNGRIISSNCNKQEEYDEGNERD